MISLKKTALAVVTLGITSVASAAMYSPEPAPAAPVPACTGVNVTVPCEKTGWDLGLQALYVQTNSVDDVTVVAANGAAVTDTTEVQNLNPDWKWGFKLDGSYHFNTGSDINVNWTHLFSEESSATTESTANDVHGRIISDPTSDQGWYNLATDVDDHFDAVNLEYGQKVIFGEHASARFHGGLEWARIERNIQQSGNDTDLLGIFGVANSDSEFNGIGPRAGVDWNYNFGNGFALVANTSAALLVGNTDLDANNNVFNDPTIVSYAASDTEEHNVVPAVESKLGLAYTHAMSQGDLTLEGGYQVNHYWNAVSEGAFDNTGAFSETDSDFSFQGAYLGVKWLANV